MAIGMVYNPYATMVPEQPSVFEQWEEARSALNQDYQRLDAAAKAHLNEYNKQTEALVRARDNGRLTSDEFDSSIQSLRTRAGQYEWSHHRKPPGEEPGEMFEDNGIQKMRKTDGDFEIIGFTPDYIKRNTVVLDEHGSIAVPTRPGEYKVIERNKPQQMKDLAESDKKFADQFATIHNTITPQQENGGAPSPTPSPSPVPAGGETTKNALGEMAKLAMAGDDTAKNFFANLGTQDRTDPEQLAQEMLAKREAYEIVKQTESVVDSNTSFANQLAAATQVRHPFEAVTKEEMDAKYGGSPEGTVVQLVDGRRYVKNEGKFWQVPWSARQIESPYYQDKFGRAIIDPSTQTPETPAGALTPGILSQLEAGKFDMIDNPQVRVGGTQPVSPPAGRPMTPAEEAMVAASGTKDPRDIGPPMRRVAPTPEEPPIPPPPDSLEDLLQQMRQTQAAPPAPPEPPEVEAAVSVERASTADTPEEDLQSRIDRWWEIPSLERQVRFPAQPASVDEVKDLPNGRIFQKNGKLYYKFGDNKVMLMPGRPTRSEDVRRMARPRFGGLD